MRKYTAADPVSAFVAQRVLGVALDRVVPVADVHRSVRSVAQIDRDEAEVFENDVADVLLGEAKVGLVPAMELDTVSRLVAYLDESALHLLRPVGEVDEFLAAGAGVGVQTDRSRMLIGVGRVERVERLCIDRVAGHVLAPVVERDAPRVGAHVGAKRS